MDKFKSVEDFPKVVEAINERIYKEENVKSSTLRDKEKKDLSWLKSIKDHLLTVINNVDYLFFHRPAEKNFTYKFAAGHHGIDVYVKKHAGPEHKERWDKITTEKTKKKMATK